MHACTHALLPMQLAILLMVLYVASASLAFTPPNQFVSVALVTVIIGGIFPFQLAVVIIIEIIHLCIRTCRKRTTKCFLTWVRYRQLYGYSVHSTKLYVLYNLFNEWLLYSSTYIHQNSYYCAMILRLLHVYKCKKRKKWVAKKNL